MKHKQSKKYSLIFFLYMKNNSEILETVDCEQWFELTEEAIIYCINEKEDYTIAFPKINLRKVKQNYGLQDNMVEMSQEKLPDGYN